MTGSKCPVSHEYSPFAADYLANPYPALARLRDQAPVAYHPELDLYAVSRYEEIVQVFEDRDTYCSQGATSPFSPVCEAAQNLLNSGFPRKPTLSNCDPPRHPAMRNAVSRCLTNRRWEKSQPDVRQYAEQLVDEIVKKPEADLMADLFFPVPAFAGFRLIGFPMEDIDLLKSWCGNRVLLTYGQLDDEQQVKAAEDLVAFWNYCRDFVELRQREPADDLTTDLLALSAERGDKFTVEDIVNVVYSVSLAAHETTTGASMNALTVLMEKRDVWDELCKDKSLIPNAVEELLRYESPTMAIRRRTTRATTLGGCEIPEGALVVMLLGAGHHDERFFENPDELDIRRENAGAHLAFGRKWHLCLGAPLARFELNLFIELLTQRMPNMRISPRHKAHYTPNMLIRCMENFWIEPRCVEMAES